MIIMVLPVNNGNISVSCTINNRPNTCILCNTKVASCSGFAILIGQAWFFF